MFKSKILFNVLRREESSTELIRLYKFEFLPNGFFSRLMVRLLHSQWRASLFWKNGIVLFKDLARLFLRYDPPNKEISITIRGPDNGKKVGSLVESINTLISDWLKGSVWELSGFVGFRANNSLSVETKIDIVIPHKFPDGRSVEFVVADIEKAIASGQTTLQNGKDSVVIESIAPDLVRASSWL